MWRSHERHIIAVKHFYDPPSQARISTVLGELISWPLDESRVLEIVLQLCCQMFVARCWL